ncbi:D-arabinose 5-phosphate isomerase [Achromatium sp. WMS2]|nr:D-arabinose 5-phosphate isomerase [Achromatium sp. WMS2]
MQTLTNVDFIRLKDLGQAVIRTEAAAVAALESRIDQNFIKACVLLLDCEGHIIVLGMGKSGHIGVKLAATLASTGSPAFFIHPGEARHGDLGMITPKDVVLALSNSGETEELIAILPALRRLGVPIIAITGNSHSTLANESDVFLDVGVEKEACPLGLAPTASTTAALAMGDALAIALLETKGFTAKDFALSHPAGSLGRKLLLRVADIMRTGDDIPQVLSGTALATALLEMSRKRLGMTAVVDSENKVIGIYTDGDLRRTLDCGLDIRSLVVNDVMTKSCYTVGKNLLAAEALHLMEIKKINGFLVVDNDNYLIGALNMHDMLIARII